MLDVANLWGTSARSLACVKNSIHLFFFCDTTTHRKLLVTAKRINANKTKGQEIELDNIHKIYQNILVAQFADMAPTPEYICQLVKQCRGAVAAHFYVQRNSIGRPILFLFL